MMGIFGNSSSSLEGKNSPFTVLVIQADAYDWGKIFGNETVEGRSVKIVQSGWEEIGIGPCENYSKEKKMRCCVTVYEETQRNEMKEKTATKRNPTTIFPELVLIRNEVYTHSTDHRNKLFGLMYSGVPCVNTSDSIFSFTERPLIMAELNKLKFKHGDSFPVIDQCYAPSDKTFMYSLPFPAVVKVGAAHAGMGKMKINDHHDMSDFRSVLAMTNGKYCLMEPFVKDSKYDIRIQCIGSTIRAFKRQDMSGEWKTNTGTSVCEEIPVTAEFKKWAELVQPLWGGLDIFTIDAIHKTDGTNVILEVNGTSSGLFPDRENEDNILIKEIVLKRIKNIIKHPTP